MIFVTVTEYQDGFLLGLVLGIILTLVVIALRKAREPQ